MSEKKEPAARRQVVLSYPHMNANSATEHLYRVEQLRATTKPHAGSYLTEEEVVAMCEDVTWNVITNRLNGGGR